MEHLVGATLRITTFFGGWPVDLDDGMRCVKQGSVGFVRANLVIEPGALGKVNATRH